MSTNARVRVLSGLAAGLTVTALFAATFTVPANAAPIDTASKFQAGSSIDASRVIKGHYLVQTAGTPTVRGGNKTATKSALATAKRAASASGAEVKGSFSNLWTGLSVTATDAQIKKLAKSPSVTAIFPVLKVALPKTQTSTADSSAALSEIAALNAGYTGDGIKVGVIDTGIDYNNVDLGGSGTNGNNADFGPSAPRVNYGSDFVGDDYNADTGTAPEPDDYPDDTCNGHGTHVAGIIGASGSGVTVSGVAPKVTFGAYRIFGCEGSSATDVILAAMSKAQTDDMDVVNMSLGSDFDSWPSYPEAVAATNMTNAGIVLVVAAGNSGDTGLFSAGTPASGRGVISVASYESSTIRSKSIGVGTDKIAYVPIQNTGTTPAVDGTTLSLRNASDNTACKTLTSVPAGTALLIKRGTCTISSKVQRAVAAGAAAVVLYDSEAGLNSFTTEPLSFAIPGVSISGTQGAALYGKIKKSGPQTMTWLGLQSGIANPGGGKISTFSSAGLAADLSLVPTISAPGGKIYSTMPIELGGHGTMSGTSMATPYVVGSVALLMEAKSLKGHPATVAQALYNTAAPVTKSTESGVTSRPEAVFRQGSGLVQVSNAIAAEVTASPSTLSLGEGTSHTVTVTLTNTTAGSLTYTPSRVSGASAAASTGSATHVGTTTPKYGFGDVGFTATPKTVTVLPGATAAVTIKLTAPSKVLKGKVGMLYGGWVKFTTTGTGNTVSVPFVGMRGDYQKVKLLNKFRYVDSANKKHALPALGGEDSNGGVSFAPSQANNKYQFDLDTFYPSAIYHLDYPASDVRLKIVNTKTKKSYWAIIDFTAGDAVSATHFGRQSRDAAVQIVTFYGYYLDSTNSVSLIGDGNYQLQLKVLKPLGNSAKSSHWESYSSPKFYINQ